MLEDFSEGRFAGPVEQALDGVLGKAAEILESNGYSQDARELMGDWTVFRIRGVLGSRDLGDHEPLLKWLAELYHKLEERFGEGWLRASHLDDIKIFNFGIPVVFTPASWDLKEYKAHFVPLAGANGFWVSQAACLASPAAAVSKLCPILGEGARYAVEHWMAPGLAGRIHRRANPEAPSFLPPSK